MATVNPFDLLGDDAEDHSPLLVVEQLNVVAVAAVPKKAVVNTNATADNNRQAQLPSKPLPPSQAVREARNETFRGGRGGDRGRGYGRGRGGFNRDSFSDENSSAPAGQGAPEGEFVKSSERNGYGEPRAPYRGGRGGRGGFSNEEAGDDGHSRRVFERRSGSGRGNEFKRDGAGRGNWGGQTDDIVQVNDEVNETVKTLGDEKPSAEDDVAPEGNKERSASDAEEKPEDKEMTLEEYEKVLEEKRKALQALKTEERKVDTKVFESMQQLSSKKNNTEIFVKLGSDKDKRKEALEKDEKSKKAVSINEFLKPARGGNYYNAGGRGRSHGRGRGGGAKEDYVGGYSSSKVQAPSIEDPGHFPTLGAK